MKEEGVKSDLEVAKEKFREDIHRKEEEAEKKIDEILSEKTMEFCSRCGKRVDSRLEWGGKCFHEGCDNLVCNDCWIVHDHRYCKEHFAEVRRDEGIPEEEIFYERRKPLAPKVLEARESGELELRMKTLAERYTAFLRDRFNRDRIDWSPNGVFKNPQVRLEQSAEESFFTFYTKFLFFRKDRVRVLVRPLLGEEVSVQVRNVLERLKKDKAYDVLALVCENPMPETVKFAKEFDNKELSLFLAEPAQELIHFNENNPVTKYYSFWFSVKEKPMMFMDILRELSEMVSGRWVISADRVSRELGFTPKRAFKLLKSRKYLSRVSGTDTFVFKEEKK